MENSAMTKSLPSATGEPLDFAALYAVEDRHFWFRERNRVIAAMVAQLTAPLAPGYRVLEVGCGTGNVLRVLEEVCRDGEVIGSELFEEGLAYARTRCHCPVLRADIFDLPFDAPFDVIGMFDVLEHLEDDRGALKALQEALTPGGALLLTVPINPRLWSYADELAGHYRRYERRGLVELLEAVGYQVEYHTPFMAALYPLMWLGRRYATLRNQQRSNPQSRSKLFARDLQVRPIMNRVLTWLHHWEAGMIARRKRLPWGTSMLVVARKPPVAVVKAA
jgi:SAM-dependent methyltransferase